MQVTQACCSVQFHTAAAVLTWLRRWRLHAAVQWAMATTQLPLQQAVHFAVWQGRQFASPCSWLQGTI